MVNHLRQDRLEKRLKRLESTSGIEVPEEDELKEERRKIEGSSAGEEDEV